jgi:addiction module HigA family antidote
MLPSHRVSTHPGEILREDILEPLDKSAGDLAAYIHEPVARIEAILRCEEPVDAGLAWKFAMALGTTPQFWLNLQSAHDLTRTRPQQTLARLVG